MPPDVRDWLAEDHLAWFVLDAVAGMELGEFYGAYRRDGVGRRAYDPAMVVALLLYSYSRGVRSARAIERACREDVACRVIAMLEQPDHATIARFVERHEAALAELFGQVLGLCDQAGLVRPGVVAIDGTRLAGNTSRGSNRDFGQIAREILAEAKAIDEAEDELYGDARGDELPEQLRTREGRREFFRQARERLAAKDGDVMSRAARSPSRPSGSSSTLSRSSRGPKGGRGGCGRHAVSSSSVAGRLQTRSRAAGLIGCCSPPSGWRMTSTRNWRAIGPMRSTAPPAVTPRGGISVADRMRGSRRWLPDAMVSVTDPDSRHIKANEAYVQGYNAQAVVDENQIVLAAEITNSTVDFSSSIR